MFHQIRSYNDPTFRNLSPSSTPWSNKNLERDLAYSICSKIFHNIYSFPYVYFTNGITEAINYYATNFKIQKHKYDYRYLNIFKNVSTTTSDIVYQSYPFAGDGKFYPITKNKPVILDCAYLFSSNLNSISILPENVESVMFSLSKSHNLSDYRIAWVFSKNKIDQFHILQYENNYSINTYTLSALNAVNSKPLNFLYLKYQETFSNLYNKHKLTENDTNLFAIKNNIRIPWYLI